MKKKKRTVLLFALGFLAAGVMHSFDRLLNLRLTEESAAEHSAALAFVSTLLFVLNLAIYVLLIVRWAVSLYRRLLPSRGRSYLITAAAFMLFFLFQRALKYRLTDPSSLLEHICWYTYYIPLGVIPSMFLLTCLNTLVNEKRRKAACAAVWISLAALLITAETNDLHYLMFTPKEEVLGSAWGTYVNGPVWYIFYGYIGVCILTGVLLLALSGRRRGSGRQALPPVLILLAMFGLMTLPDRYLPAVGFPFPWAFPETSVFCMLGIFEACIRSRLIPHNENYAGFFSNLRLPAVITDCSFRPVYRSASPVGASNEQLERALSAPVDLGGGAVLYGRRLAGGNAFWVSDESEMRRLNEELENLAETLESENDLLRFENEQKEARARVDARNRVYTKAAEKVYPTQKKIAALLEKTVPGEASYASNMARILVYNAYVKRKTNFVLLSAERDTVSAKELFAALEESAKFLMLCGVRTGVERRSDRDYPSKEASALYDAFEIVIESLSEGTSDMMICLNERSLRLMTDRMPALERGGAPTEISVFEEDGQVYIDLTPRGEEEGGAL